MALPPEDGALPHQGLWHQADQDRAQDCPVPGRGCLEGRERMPMTRSGNAQGVNPERLKTRAGKTLDLTVSGLAPNVKHGDRRSVPRFTAQASD
jgi:hypothetical protein